MAVFMTLEKKHLYLHTHTGGQWGTCHHQASHLLISSLLLISHLSIFCLLPSALYAHAAPGIWPLPALRFTRCPLLPRLPYRAARCASARRMAGVCATPRLCRCAATPHLLCGALAHAAAHARAARRATRARLRAPHLQVVVVCALPFAFCDTTPRFACAARMPQNAHALCWSTPWTGYFTARARRGR